uniref:Apolipoprotein D n=1 Tax=Culicoides sonorensis TaxID=179676 RepID=A0A336M3D4_CULSO
MIAYRQEFNNGTLVPNLSTMALKHILLLIGFVAITSAQVPYFSGCPKVNVMQGFNPESYLGRWYEYEKYPFLFELGGKCITADYTLRPDGKVGVHNRQVNQIFGTENTITGFAVPNESEPAKLSVSFPSVSSSLASPYWVLYTDYQNYAVVFSCSEFAGLASTRMIWILTRERFPAPEIVQVAYDIIDNNGLSKSFLIKTDHQNCDATMRKG